MKGITIPNLLKISCLWVEVSLLAPIYEKTNKRLQNYYECIGCGECVDVSVKRGRCKMCGSQMWIAKTTYIKN